MRYMDVQYIYALLVLYEISIYIMLLIFSSKDYNFHYLVNKPKVYESYNV
jgi:hypothetical protein